MTYVDKQITLLHLYSQDMNTYGDDGNVLVLKKRLEWHGYRANVIEYNQGDIFPDGVDLIVGGGGQDVGQKEVSQDLGIIGQKIIDLAKDGVPMLVICGMYQLFGKSFTTLNKETIPGIGLFDAYTEAGSERLTGNIIIKSNEFDEIIGFENHSGQTYLGGNQKPLGSVSQGAGNNLADDNEGATFNNVIGSYLHGPILPKNPILADWLIEKAVIRRYDEFQPTVIDDRFASEARVAASKRPR